MDNNNYWQALSQAAEEVMAAMGVTENFDEDEHLKSKDGLGQSARLRTAIKKWKELKSSAPSDHSGK